VSFALWLTLPWGKIPIPVRYETMWVSDPFLSGWCIPECHDILKISKYLGCDFLYFISFVVHLVQLKCNVAKITCISVVINNVSFDERLELSRP
jgi:hypothetical protein